MFRDKVSFKKMYASCCMLTLNIEHDYEDNLIDI